LTQEHLYQHFVRTLLQGITTPVWHLVIDRTPLWERELDLVTLSLNYRKRAIPLGWCLVQFGGAPLADYVDLLYRCYPLVPRSCHVIFHGDTEFGGAAMIRALVSFGWDFILAQKNTTCFRSSQQSDWHSLSELNVTPTRQVRVAHIELFKAHRVGGLNLLAFYQPHNTATCRKRDVCYLVTSLPLTPGVRRLGRRRWAIEPFHRDFKSAGWQITLSQLKHPTRKAGLLVICALVYAWTVCVGRWLCKTRRRRAIDAKAKRRHLSLFRLGWDWYLHRLRCGLPIPIISRLYS
jgi:hypothetical protein